AGGHTGPLSRLRGLRDGGAAQDCYPVGARAGATAGLPQLHRAQYGGRGPFRGRAG
ncbi:unnamed protein product, partial [Heterosigma akashiwo]